MREIMIACSKLDGMQAAFDEARIAGRWDKKRECYTDPQGNPLVDSKNVVLKIYLRSFLLLENFTRRNMWIKIMFQTWRKG
ncbi:hypothetical protein Hanom_Chr16g01423541 [Helianthus anomalus]